MDSYFNSQVKQLKGYKKWIRSCGRFRQFGMNIVKIFTSEKTINYTDRN